MAQASSCILKWNPRAVLLFLLILNRNLSLLLPFSFPCAIHTLFLYVSLFYSHGFPFLPSCRWYLVHTGVPCFSRSKWMTRRGKSQGVALWRSLRSRQRVGNEWKDPYERGKSSCARISFPTTRKVSSPSWGSSRRSFLIINTPDS